MLKQILIALTIASAASTAAYAQGEPYWIFFIDRGDIDTETAIAASRIAPDNPKLKSRRAQVVSHEVLIDERDLPVNPAYVQAIREIGGTIRHETRYLNGVSAVLTEDQYETAEQLPFVRGMRPVGTFHRPYEPALSPVTESGQAEKTALLPYGNSFDQVNMVGATGLHDLGYFGEGILIAVLDNGFDNMGHVAFDSLTIVNAYDFVDGDSSPTGGVHGTRVISVMGALDYGNMIGIAPKASYLLARTEINNGNNDTHIEEDNWVAAVEWADSLGVDVINSSLGYLEFADGSSYTYEELDGMTAVTTVAANTAVSKGIVVVTSAGNEGNTAWHYITTPADGFDVIAVGAIGRDGEIASTSSHGPTADGRIKPDFVALGIDVLVTDTNTSTAYSTGDGTSFASPAIAGAAALILQANPTWGPIQVIQAMRNHASRAGDPDTDEYAYGYGTIDALKSSGIDVTEPPVAAFTVFDPFPQPVQFSSTTDRVYFPVDVPEEGALLTIRVYNIAGDLVVELSSPVIGSGQLRNRGTAPSWNGTNFTGDDVAPGIYYYTIELAGYGTHRGKIAVLR